MNLQESIDFLAGKPYLKNGHSVYDKGLDCFGLIKEYSRIRYSIFLPNYHKGSRLENYTSVYQVHNYNVMNELEEYLSVFYSKSSLDHSFFGDILTCYDPNGSIVAGVYAGLNCFLGCAERYGSLLMPLNDFSIRSVFKWDQAKAL